MHTLLTQRCFLRDYGEGDRIDFLSLQKDEAARAHLGAPLTEEEAEELFAQTLRDTDPREGRRWAVFERKSNDYWGHVYLAPWEKSRQMEWGVLLAPTLWRDGIGEEVSVAALSDAFRTMHLEAVIATADPRESPWRSLIENLGMSRIQRCQDDWGIYDVYKLSASNWKISHANADAGEG